MLASARKAFGIGCAVALCCAGCPHTGADRSDASVSDGGGGDGPNDADTDGGDAQCLAAIELDPVTFVNLYAGWRKQCAEAVPAAVAVRVWAWRDGILVRDVTLKCGDRVWLQDLEPGAYTVSMIGFVDGTPYGSNEPAAWYAVGASLLPGVYEGYVAQCTPGLLPCEAILVDVAGCGTTTTPADVYCWEGVSWTADGCGF